MRVISGKYRGKRLKCVRGDKVRPTSDKLKAAIFNVLFSQGLDRFDDLRALDLFAGSGALGIEALSRGAKSCYFIDKDIDSVNIVKANLKNLNLIDKNQARVVLRGHIKAIEMLRHSDITFDLIFLDPPYNQDLIIQAIENICECGIFSNHCLVVAEHSIKEELPGEIKKFRKVTEKYYGSKVLSFFEVM